MKHTDFTDDAKTLIDFVDTTGPTGGGDFPEAYEYVLQKVQDLDWQSNNARCLVMIGDATPHAVNENPFKIDWKKEAKKLHEMGVSIYSVQCLDFGSPLASKFWRELAKITEGYHLKLDQFSFIKDFMLAVCYKQVDEAKVENLQEEMEERMGGLPNNVRLAFDRLLGNAPAIGEKDEKFEYTDVDGDDEEDDGAELLSVPPARFQILHVEEDTSIKNFVQEMGLIFEKGKGFYQFTKPEDIQPNKEVVLRKRGTGELFAGRRARRLAGIPDEKTRVKPTNIPDYDVFVQSTSYNRKLIGGTEFLYEVPKI